MKKHILLSLLTVGVLSADQYTVEVKKDKWNLLGTSNKISVSELNLNDNEYLWIYSNGKWYVNKEINGLEKIDENGFISENTGFWISATSDRTITLNDTANSFVATSKGWTLYGFDKSHELTDIDSSVVNSIWGYNDSWSVWGLSESQYTQSNLKKLDNLETGKGYWVNSNSGYSFKNIRNSTDGVEDIWKLYLPIDATKNNNGFEISVALEKHENDGSNDIGSFTYKGLSLKDGVLSIPTGLFIYGKGDSSSGSKLFTDENLRNNSISLDGNLLVLNLGYVMKEQNYADEETFTHKTTYDISINVNSESTNTVGTIEIK